MKFKTDEQIYYDVDSGLITQEKFVEYNYLVKTLNTMRSMKQNQEETDIFKIQKNRIYIKIINELIKKLKKSAGEK